jgi:hypothetical protein
MKRWVMAAVALAALGACNQLTGGGEPPLPTVQAGAQAPTVLAPKPPVQQANVTPEVRTQLLNQIKSLLDQTQEHFAAGMVPANGLADEIKPMQPGTDHRWPVTLTAATPYTFIGACDGDCTNIDIELIDMRTGGVVASDMLPDDYPVVAFTPPANGQYLARVILQTCTTAPCYTGMRALTPGAAAPTNK